MNKEIREGLSPEGIDRREAMLGDLLGSLARTRKRRTARRTGVALIMLAGLLGAWSIFRTEVVEPDPRQMDQRVAEQESNSSGGFVVRLVSTDVSVIDRFRADGEGQIVEVDDRSLEALLAEIGRPAQVIRDGNKVHLSQPVSDAELSGNE